MRQQCRRSPRRDGGFALLIVLWTLVIITLLVSQVTSTGRGEAALAANLRRAAQLQAETDGALHTAIFHLLDPVAPWQADGTARQMRFPGSVVTLRIIDEFGKINPNLAPAPMMAALLRAVGAGADEADRLGAAIQQWRSPSAEPPASGVKAQLYGAAGRNYAPPSAAFESIGELGLVLGMTPALLARLAPHLTLYTDDQADARLADPVVAQVLAESGVSPGNGPPPRPRVVTIVADAVAAQGGRFVRQAVVSLGPDSAGRLFRVVTWQAPPPSQVPQR